MGVRPMPKMRRRRGVVTLEFILAAPVIIILLFAAFQFAVRAMYQSAVTHAATVAAREAAKDTGTGTPAPDVVHAVVVDVLHDFIRVADDCADNDAEIPNAVSILVEQGPTDGDGDGNHDEGYVWDRYPAGATCGTPTDDLGLNEVRVTVCFDLKDTTFFDCAWDNFGFTPGWTTLTASAVTTKEFEQDLPPL